MKIKILGVLLALVFTSACSSLVSQKAGKNTISSSLMNFLYPKESSRTEHIPEMPLLRLPVKVGIAFVPAGYDGIHANDQLKLLDKVRKSFDEYDYIERIEIIPSTYLKEGGGFDSLEQISRLYDVDIMALVSYDQVTQSLENNAALLYWTIVGMYVIPGNENSIQTFVDTAVFDVASKRMLFRAPGINRLEKRSTAIGVNDTVSKKSLEGFSLAVDDMIVNLDAELKRFNARVKEGKAAKVERREGYKGSGSLGDYAFIVLLLFMLRRFKTLKPV